LDKYEKNQLPQVSSINKQESYIYNRRRHNLSYWQRTKRLWWRLYV